MEIRVYRQHFPGGRCYLWLPSSSFVRMTCPTITVWHLDCPDREPQFYILFEDFHAANIKLLPFPMQPRQGGGGTLLWKP